MRCVSCAALAQMCLSSTPHKRRSKLGEPLPGVLVVLLHWVHFAAARWGGRQTTDKQRRTTVRDTKNDHSGCRGFPLRPLAFAAATQAWSPCALCICHIPNMPSMRTTTDLQKGRRIEPRLKLGVAHHGSEDALAHLRHTCPTNPTLSRISHLREFRKPGI